MKPNDTFGINVEKLSEIAKEIHHLEDMIKITKSKLNQYVNDASRELKISADMDNKFSIENLKQHIVDDLYRWAVLK